MKEFRKCLLYSRYISLRIIHCATCVSYCISKKLLCQEVSIKCMVEIGRWLCRQQHRRNEAENRLYDLISDMDMGSLEIALLFYSYLNDKADEFLEENNFCR